jgi:two-component system sensor kinase FixL
MVDKENLEESLREREALLGAIVDIIPGALIIIDTDGIVRSFSRGAERMFGYAAAEMTGQKINMLMPSPYREEHDGYIRRYLKTGEKRIIGIGRIVAAQRKDGSTFPMELAVGEVETPHGHYFVGSARDITARERAERQIHELQTTLSQASRLSAMGEMSSGLAHELNQPISAIMSYIDAALHLLGKGGEADVARVSDMLGKAATQSRRAGQIVHHLRRFVLTGETEKTEEDLNVVVQDSLAMALVGTRSTDAAMSLDLGATLPRVLVDRVQIQQVVVNLVRNGMEAIAGRDAPALSVSTRRDGNFLVVTVADNGPGIDPEVAEQIFNPFVTTKPKGMGIGLSICRSIVEGHGGRIWTEESSSGGATFVFTVPAVVERKEAPRA